MYELALHRKYKVLVTVGVYESPASPTLLPPVDAVVYQPLAVNPVRAAGVGRVNAVPPSMKSSVNGEIAVPPFVVATDQNLSAISYNATCVGANNSSPDDGYGPTDNKWGALEFNALAGYGDGVTDLALKKRTGNTEVDTGIKISANITGDTGSGCMGVYESPDWYGGIVNPNAINRRTTETLNGVSYVHNGKYFAVSRTLGAKWENVFTNLDPYTNYQFQFIYLAWGPLVETITSKGYLNGVEISSDFDNVSLLNVGAIGQGSFRKNRITVSVSGYDKYTFTRDFNGGYKFIEPSDI